MILGPILKLSKNPVGLYLYLLSFAVDSSAGFTFGTCRPTLGYP